MDNKNKIACSNVTMGRRPVVHQGGRRVVAPSGAAAGSVQFRDGRGVGGGGRGFHAGQSQGKIAEQAIPIPHTACAAIAAISKMCRHCCHRRMVGSIIKNATINKIEREELLLLPTLTL